MEKILIVSEKDWHIDYCDILSKKIPQFEWILVSNKIEFNYDYLCEVKPIFIFIPHWSYIIPQEIHQNFNCVLFHMTDLPFGRGGSPLQNLIVRGFSTTKISAINVTDEIDAGNIYLKKDLSLDGTAKEIFERSGRVILEMIIEIISEKLIPTIQTGEITTFKRRKRHEGNLSNLNEISKIYDYIRMLDCPGYPNAFLETDNFVFEFYNAELNNKEIIANVRISKK